MEIWKDIEGFEGRYQISNLGNVMSLNYMSRGYAALLTPKINVKGYMWVALWQHKKCKPMLVHRLVASAFIENPNNYPIVNHKDENPLNNNVSNLEWCTHKYNVQYSLNLHPERMRKIGERRVRKRAPYKLSKRVRQIDLLSGEVVREYQSLADIKWTLGKNNYNVRECCLGNRNKAYGYKWEFCD